MSTIKDGWHTTHGYDLYVEGGYVKRATKLDYNGSLVTAWIYQWNKSYHAWMNVSGNRTFDTVRNGLTKGTYKIV